MTRTFVILALSASLAVLAVPSDVFAGRGGGRGGGGGGGGGGRGGYGGGGYGGGEMGHSPSFSQPHSSANEYHPQGSGESGNRSQTENRSSYGNQPEPGTRPATGNTANAGNRNSNANYPNAGAAAAGAGAANRNQTPDHPNAGAAAAGAGAANRNQSPEHPNAGAAAAGAGAANRNQSPEHPNAGAAAAGAGVANNRNQGSAYPNAGAAAAGAGYANRNQGSAYPNAGAAVAGAGVANNRNQYNQYHPGMGAGYWNGNYANAWGMGGGGYGGVGAWGTGSSLYGWGYSGYSNPYSGGSGGGGGGGQQVDPNQPAPAYDYSQPISTTAAAPAPTAADQATASFDQARDAFKSGDYATALQLNQQALGQMPNDTTIHEFQALALFARGRYEQAAAPLHAVLAVGPGWNWTTLIGNYPDANTYTEQVRGLETYVKANPKSAQARFVLAYHYIAQGHNDAAVKQLKGVVALQPNDTLSAQLVTQLQPAGASSPTPIPAPEATTTPEQLTGTWVAPAPQNAKITLTMKDDGGFTWVVAGSGKPPMSIAGTATLANGVLSLAGKDTQAGALAGQVVRQDDSHFRFRALGGPADDPGLKFAR